MEYTVSKEKGSSRYYVHRVGDPKNPIPGTYAPKKRALHTAADMNGMDFKEYMKARKEEKANADA